MSGNVKWPILGAVVGLVVMLVATACTSTSGGTPIQTGTVKVEAGEYFFKPDFFTVKAGATITFSVTNVGKLNHTMTFPDLNKGTSAMPPGATESFQMTFANAGDYVFICTVPGHADSGMKGTVKVVP